jgi:hypothetical protein
MRQDLYLVVALGAMLVLRSEGALAMTLAVAIPLAIGWSVVTLHLPSRVLIDDHGVVFSAYGREHRFAWRDVERVYVRRFVVRDRVLVRILPSPPLRGRYWLLDSMGGYDTAVRTLEQRAQRHG